MEGSMEVGTVRRLKLLGGVEDQLLSGWGTQTSLAQWWDEGIKSDIRLLT